MLAEPPFSLLENFARVDDAIDTNAEIAESILAVGLQSFGLSTDPDPDDLSRNWHGTATSSDVNKAHSTIRQFYRDWSVEGRAERDVCYGSVLCDLRDEFGTRLASGDEIKVLVPGAGLGRLVFDLCQAGYSAEGNEISYHQLLASSWVLNHSEGAQRHPLYPFATHFSNLRTRAQQLTRVMIPDVHPASAMMAALDAHENSSSNPKFGTMSMSAADFVVLYRGESHCDTFDAVATVFFIDTAPNLIRYIETIHNCLKPNGVWINVGPLLWHFDDHGNSSIGEEGPTRSNGGGVGADTQKEQPQGIGEPGNVELTEEDVLRLVERMGFRLEKGGLQESDSGQGPASCGYIQDPQSMLQNLYRPSHWMARKIPRDE